MKNGEIHAVEWVRRIRDQHAEVLKAKSSTEWRAFYRERARRLHERLGIPKEEQRTA